MMSIEAKQEITNKYKKILNDLLDISRNDSCIFSNLNSTNNFDVRKKFGDNFFETLISNETFLIPLTQIDDKYFIEKINKSENIEELKKIYLEFEEEIPLDLEMKLSKKNVDFNSLKKVALESIEKQKQKSIFMWKRIFNKANLINEQNNLWPLHLGFIYITLKIENKIIQAPLFLKQVNIKIENSKVFLVSVGDIKINEKLLYFLESNDFLLNLDIDYSKLSIKELFSTIKNSWSQNFVLPETLKGLVPNFKKEDIDNELINFWPGVSLGFFEPTGGYLRKIMIDILEKDLLDQILDIEFDKNIYKNVVVDSIFKKNFGFYKINHSNLSQDKAVVSALNQNTIIWGPPGTGKSQTITNILANILMFDKTALVVSEKKAALEVLKDRMKSLKMFCLFILNDSDMNKKNFYKPIQEYIDFLENFNEKIEENKIKIISDEEKEIMKLINSVMKHEFYKENILLFSEYEKNNEFNNEVLVNLMNLNPKIKYNSFEQIKSKKINPRKIGKFLMKNNNIKSKNVFCRTTKEIKEDSKNIFNNLMNKNLDIDYLLSFKDKLDLDVWNNLYKIKNSFSQNKENILINDHNNLKILIAKRIFYKIKNFDDKMQEKYKKFSLDARLSHLDPIIFIKRHIDIVKELYSIIVTTPETDLQSWNREEFDYALLDESSQIFLEKGIPILYFAKIKIFAGDDQQMQPSRWFSSRIEQESPFGKVESLLDYAIAKGTYTLLLDKNYRSSFASLMLFNSQVFYKGELDVVDTKFLNKKDPIEVINVDGVWEDSKNEKELIEIINQATLNLNKYNKIILLAFNSSQQSSIENLIIESHPELELAINQKKLLIRNIENIQGDEADLLIVSVAYDKNTKLHSTYIAKSGGKNALNVATSRAREKMIVIKSIYSNEIQNPSDSEDIFVFKEWLKFLDLSEEQRKEYLYIKNDNSKKETQKKYDNNIENELENNLIKKIESDLSKEVIGFGDKYDIKLNYSIGTIKIPFVVLDKKTNSFVVGLYLDNFQYWKSYNEYVMDKDLENFFKIKKYNIERISHLNWEQKKDSIFKEIENFEKQFN